MRPGNFPTIRLAQLAMLIHKSAHLFSKIKEEKSVNKINEWFDVTANDYWHYHYRFEESSAFRKKKLGKSMIDNIIINTIVPVLFAYGSYYNKEKYKQKALQWLEEISGEINSITNGFQKLMRHSNVSTTLWIYSHAPNEARLNAQSENNCGVFRADLFKTWWPGTGLNRRRRPFQGPLPMDLSCLE